MALLTAEDILNKKFAATKFREGYDVEEVDDFLDEVVRTLNSVQEENEDLKAKLADANKTVTEREAALAAARAQVQRERKALGHDVDAVRRKLAELDHQLKYLPGRSTTR